MRPFLVIKQISSLRQEKRSGIACIPMPVHIGDNEKARHLFPSGAGLFGHYLFIRCVSRERLRVFICGDLNALFKEGCFIDRRHDAHRERSSRKGFHRVPEPQVAASPFRQCRAFGPVIHDGLLSDREMRHLQHLQAAQGIVIQLVEACYGQPTGRSAVDPLR